MKGWMLLLLILFAGSALADMPIVYIPESSLPYEFSPTNYDNSPANYENGLNSNHRLYCLPDSIHMTWAGYFVVRDNGYVNFFSPDGHRVFYAPKGHAGVFSAADGSFCGVVAQIKGRLSLVLTSHGTEVFHKLNDQSA